MIAMQRSDSGLSTGRLLKLLGLLWLTGIASRVTILAVPPVIPLIHDDLHMSETQIGALIGLPLVVFAVFAIPGSLLIARFGAVRTMAAGAMIAGLAAAARGGAWNVPALYAATVAMGFGIAIMQPALPTLVKEWLPARTGLGTAVSTNGLLVGVALAPALTTPFVLPWLERSWRLALVFWAALALAAGLAFWLLAPPSDRAAQPEASAARRWWPDWRDPLMWLLGLTFGANNALYYGTNAFLPDYLTSLGRTDLVGAAVGWLNTAQLVASFVLLATADRLQRRLWPYLVFGLSGFAGVLGIVLTQGYGKVIAAGVVGFSAAITFVVTLALPPMLSPPEDIHRLAGGMFTISFACAVVTPIVCGAIWDLTGVPWSAFVPLGLCSLILISFGARLSLRSAAH
jgi:CP family cyanate transporter-like MFS transporter